MADKDDNQYQRLPVVLQTTAVKNFFEYTVDQLYSEANVETLNGFVGTPDWDGVRAEGAYIEEPTATKQAYALSPTINTISPETGEPESLIYYDEVVDILKTYGVDVRNQNKLFDAPYFTFSPPINEDKLVNYSEYYWAPPGANVTPNAIIISGTVESPIDVTTDILGKQYYVYYGETANVTFRNGMVITFEGDYIVPETYANVTYVVEGVGHEIDLVPLDRNTTAPYDANAEPSYVVIERGAVNNNGWSRNNYWYHKNNWYDADQVPPDRIYRAQRPIIEFNHRLETFNTGTNFLQSVDIAVQGYNYDQVNGLSSNVDIDGVDPANKTMIFPSEGSDKAPYVYLGVPFDIDTTAVAYGNETDPDPVNAVLEVEISGEPGEGFVDRIIVLDEGQGYVPSQTEVIVFSNNPDITEDALAVGTVYKGVKTGTTSVFVVDAGMGYQANTISINFQTDLPTGQEIEPIATARLNSDGSINQIDVITRGDDYDYDANITVTITGPNTSPAICTVVSTVSYLDSVTVVNPGAGYTQYQSIVLEPVANVNVGDSVLINEGTTQRGNEYYYTEDGWVLADTKRTSNDAPLFVIYDDTGTRLDDEAKYPQSDFAGNKIFSYATPNDIVDEDAASVATTLAEDPILGFPLVFRPFKASSEIVFTNNLEHDKYTYTPLGSEETQDILGYNFYHLLAEGSDAADEYYPYWKPSDRPYNQAIVSRYPISQIEIDRNIRQFFIGCVPNPAPYNFSGVDVKMYLNGKPVKGFKLVEDVEGFILVDSNVVFRAGDYVEIVAYSDTGLLSLQSASKYELPIGWDRNVFKENIRFTSEPEYLEHFKTQIESQIGFVGEPLGQNNYQSTAQDTSYATEIVQSDSDVILAGYLLDDQPHNLIDALRFNSGEYTKYKDRLKKTINDYYATQKIDENNIDRTLEMILREVIAFRVGKNVFNRTYVVPFGDNFFMEQQTIGASTDTIVLDSYLDLSLIEHSLLVFATPQGSLFTDMLMVDRDYVIESYNPITIKLIGDYLGSTITTKLYTAERDSAQCPPTPSVLGIYPLFQPEITMDDTFETPQEVLIGHDGSRTPTYGDARDQLLLDFEQRIYNAAKKEFREANSLPELNFFDIRPGAFRNTGFSYVEWYNLMRYHFSTWASVNQVDPVTNEFYDKNDPWTWNYRGYSDVYPGHWRGLYEYYYDTVRPHTHPWEMLGFTEKPLWWDSQYGTDYGSGNDAMWNDLESGIIRQGPRENLTQDLWKLPTNPYARPNLFKYLPVDQDGELILPNKLPSGITTTDIDYIGQVYDWTTYPVFVDSFTWYNSTNKRNSILPYPGIDLSYSGANVYVQSEGILHYDPPPGRFEPQPFNINLPNSVTVGPSSMPVGDSIPDCGLIGISVNGIALINPKSGRSFNNQNVWHYNEVFEGEYTYENPGKYDSRGGYQYYIIPPQAILKEWGSPTILNDDTTVEIEGTHSPIIGWALDGLPIYGPYGYTEYSTNGQIVDDKITNIKSPFRLRSDMTAGRPNGPGGNPTGMFVEDYVVDPVLVGTAGYAGTNTAGAPGENFAIRYGITPDSPDTPRWFYVQCEDDDGNPMFPYAVGGGIQTFPDSYSNKVYNNQFFGTPNDYDGVFRVEVTDCGYDYTGVAGVRFVGDGQNANGYSIIKDGVIRNMIVVNRGKNYAWDTTTIEIIGDGQGATCEPVVIDGQIVSVKMTNFGEGYTYATPVIKQVPNQDGTFPGQFAELKIPTLAEDPENGIVNNAVTEVVVTNKGYGYSYVDVVIESVVGPQPPILTPILGYGATASAILETRYNNPCGSGYKDPNALPIMESNTIEILNTDMNLTESSWRYSDGAPVENAWKYSVNYPFAVAEGLLLGQPAQFATQYADPTKLYRTEIDSRQQLCTVTRERWQFTDPEQFRIHGERDAEGNFLTNIGYTQFINSWLAFQGLDTNIEFAPQLRTINMRLSHRMSGYIDKDTMTVRTDQYSATGTTPSLIIPQDNINVQIHSSPYKSRNFYTGVIIEKAVGGYKVRGYDRSVGTFPVLKIDKYSPSRALKVGGEPAPYSQWERNQSYKKNSIVTYRGVFYRAPNNLTSGADFDARLWTRLPSLPQINGAEAEIWSKYLNQVDFVPYETLLKTSQEVVDLLMSLGAWQKNAGYDFEGFDYNTGDTIDWTHASKQFLFWTTGKWEIGNTLELSPMAGGATFKAPRGFIAKLNRIDRNQFTILDADGSAITPESCEIIRLEDYIQVKPPQGAQIYGMMVFVKEIEHAMTLENRTDFNDIIYDPVLHQYQTRVKIKGKRTANWDGKFTSEGFIILDDELKPNLDNLAQSMGRYHELGFIPVEKQVYESARALFGYQSRAYLRDLDILDDQQFDFYKGMLQSKGTQTSMTRIGESNSIIIDGQITVYDEWAVKVGDFGDVESQQSIEFKLDRSNVTSDPQLVTLVFPEDVTGIVERVDVINRNNSYLTAPAIVISPPLLANGTPAPNSRQATAKSHLRPDGKLDYIEMTDKGRGYEFATASIITQGDNSNDAGTNIEFTQAVAIGGLSDQAWAEQPINGNCWIKTKYATVQFSQMTLTDDGLIVTPSNVALYTTSTNTKLVVGDTITITDQSGVICKSDGVTCADLDKLNGTFTITGVEETTSGTTVEFTATQKIGPPSTYGVSVVNDLNTMVMLEFDNVYYHEANILVTPFEFGGKEIEDIINAETANTGVTASMYASHVPNERQPGQTGDQVIDWYTLVLRSDSEFELIEESPSNVWSKQFHISTGTYRNQQRWAIDVASGTEAEDITVYVNGQIIDQCKFYEVSPDGVVTGNCEVYNWEFMPGGIYEGTANVSNANQPTLTFNIGAFFPSGEIYNSLQPYDTDPYVPVPEYDDETTTVLVDGDYPFLDLMIGDIVVKPTKTVFETVGNVNTPVTKTVWQANDGFTQIILYPEMLPESIVDPNGEQPIVDLPIKLVEKASIKFTDDFTGDIYGSNISIDVSADDDLLCKIGRERTYEITKDIANDDIIVIDVDDPTRFLKKPTGEMTNQLWPLYDDVNYLGVRDSKDYATIPNAGYVNSANVNFQAYDLGSLPLLFDPSLKIQPTGGHTIHVASSENSDWNVYELRPTAADIQFLARQDDRLSLFTNFSLFNYIDGNMIGEDDTGRFLDYYLTLRNADVSDNVVVWTNETIIQQAQSTITNLTAPRMIEARLRSLSPSEDSIRNFTNYLPIGDSYYNNINMSPSGLDQGQQIQTVSTISAYDISTDTLFFSEDPNNEEFLIYTLGSGLGTGANFTMSWDVTQIGVNNYEATANANSIVWTSTGEGYEVGDEIYFGTANIMVGTGTLRVTEVSRTQTGYVRSNVITVGGINTTTIQDGDVVRLIEGGSYARATVSIDDILIDYGNFNIAFANVSNADEFIVDNLLYVDTSPVNSVISGTPFTILNNLGNTIIVSSSVIQDPTVMDTIDSGSFGGTNELRSLNQYDLGESDPNDEDTYYNVFNVTNKSGFTSFQIERPNTYINYADVTSEVYDITVVNNITCRANVTANLFTAYSHAIGIDDFDGQLGPLNGLWPVINVAPNPFDANVEIISFNTIRTLPQGTYVPAGNVFMSDTAMKVNVQHLNKTRLVMPNVTDIKTGDQIKVLANSFNGVYNADKVVREYNVGLNDDSFITYVDIPAPYIFDSNRSGNVLLGGLKFTTTNPHGITPAYAAQNKRIAVHFAYPKAYNKIYNISRVDAYNIYVDEVMTQTAETINYYTYDTVSLAKDDNIYVTSDEVLLTRVTATYAGNAEVINTNLYTVNRGKITFGPELFPASGNYVTLNIIREIDRSYDRYPVVTTVDHNKIRLNGVNFTINSYNNEEAIVDNINRAASLMRGWVTPAGNGMTFSFPMVKDYRTPVFAPDGSLRPAHTINNYGPYIRDKNTIAMLKNDPDIDTGVISVSNGNEASVDPEFNLGSIKIGPTKGATYFDQDEKVYMIWLQEGPTDTEGGYYPLGVYYNDKNRTVLPKRKKIFKITPASHVDGGPIVNIIPGSYPVRRADSTQPGQTQYEYDMGAVKEFKFPAQWIDRSGAEVIPAGLADIQDNPRPRGTVKLYRYRLKPSTQGYYEVYENVELSNGEVIAIKVDSAIPGINPQDYYKTQTAYNNFYSISSNSINFDSKVAFNAAKVDLYPSYSGGSLNIPPVQPPADVGKTTIPEPYAIRRSGRTMGNGSDSLLNFAGLPDTRILVDENNNYTIQINKPGYMNFSMWQPGIIPGLQNPPTTAQTAPKPFGKGDGYYESGDGNVPEMFQVISTKDQMMDEYDYANITMGWADPRHCPGNNPYIDCTIDDSTPVTNDYPVIDVNLGWANPQPRFKYSKRFSIGSSTSNNDATNDFNGWANSSVYFNSQESRYAFKTENDQGNTTVYLNGNYPDQSNTTFRPDEIFVACFWTERHLYKDQIVGYGPDPQNSGNPREIRKDYFGTITRCKYIRLTELPLDAVLQRPECDTGWGGSTESTSYQDGATTRGRSDATADDLLTGEEDVVDGTSATQNRNDNTGADYTGGTTEENPDANETGAYDTNTRQSLPGGYEAKDNILIGPDDVGGATPPNPEAQDAPGIGLSDLSAVAFEQRATGDGTPNNAGANINDRNKQQDTGIDYPTVPNTDGGASPVFNPSMVILPGPCDITAGPEGNTTVVSAACDEAPSAVLTFTGSNNYYGIIRTGTEWAEDSENYELPKYEWHNFGKLVNAYNGGGNGYVEIVVDFRDDRLTAGGITLVQAPTEFGTLLSGQTFNPRDPNQQGFVNSWWSTASVVARCNSSTGTSEADMLYYGVNNFGNNIVVPPGDRATGNNIPLMESRIGVTASQAATFNNGANAKRPSDWGFGGADSWYTSDIIIGGSNSGVANLNSIKGVFGFRNNIECGFGQYLTVFIHIGHESGKTGSETEYVVPRYDFAIRYNHNLFGYGGTDETFTDVCGTGEAPASMDYASGAKAKAYKSGNEASQAQEYKFGAAIRAGVKQYVNWGSAYTGTKDDTGILEPGQWSSWLFDNVYFPYNAPARQGEPVGNNQTGELYQLCCDPGIYKDTPLICGEYLATVGCGGSDDGNPGFGGGCVVLESYLPGSQGRAESINQAYLLRIGTYLELGTEDLEVVQGEVKDIATDIQPCVRVVTQSGVSLVCSTTAPIYTQDGEYLNAPELLGKYVAVMVDGNTSFDEVISVDPVGDKFVAVIDTGDNNFWAGEQPGKYLMHHNMAILGSANEAIDKNKN